jgi:uncharacterized protein (TIGR03118 family)
VTNLASDVPGQAPVTDKNLVNPWGISFSPTGAFWLSENGAGVSDLLNGNGSVQPLVVSVPSSAAGAGGNPTGTVFNGGRGFNVSENGVWGPSLFLFASEAGVISGWDPTVDPTHALLAVDESAGGAVYKGLALASDPSGRTFLYAADFHGGAIDVFDQDFHRLDWAGAFRDPTIPAGYAPFNIQKINGLLFVTYAQQNQARHDDAPGAGHGFIDVYTPDGVLVQRFASAGPLDSPWGLALAPGNFGEFSNDLLVGNNGDGRINAFDPRSGAFLGPLTDASGAPLTIDHLWGLAFGNGHQAAPSNVLFFTAGIAQEQHGLFGAIRDPAVPDAPATAPGVYDPTDSAKQYPLPPENGPSLPGAPDLRPLPASVLLGLTDSSLILAPTLTGAPDLVARGAHAKVEPHPADAPGLASSSGMGPGLFLPSSHTPSGGSQTTGFLPLAALLDLGALPRAGPEATGLTWTAPGPHTSVAGGTFHATADALTEGPVIELTAAEGTVGQAEGLAERREEPNAWSSWAADLPEAPSEPGPGEREEPSGIYLRVFALAKLVLASAIVSAWYYSHGGRPGHDESPGSAEAGSKTRSP